MLSNSSWHGGCDASLRRSQPGDGFAVLHVRLRVCLGYGRGLSFFEKKPVDSGLIAFIIDAAAYVV